MKKQIFTAAFVLCAVFGYSQSNSNPWPTTGNVGIGTSAPAYKLDVRNGSFGSFATSFVLASFSSGIQLSTDRQELRITNGRATSGTDYYSTIGSHFSGSLKSYITLGRTSDLFSTFTTALTFGFGHARLMRIYEDGKVMIGEVDTPGTYKLYVEDGILTEKVKVAIEGTGDWADYVFAPDYELMTLKEVEIFTQENGHLPNVPSAEDMVANGLDVAQMDAKLLEKIEELTLYAIDQEKHIDSLEATVTTQQQEMEQTKKEMDEMKAQIKLLLEKQ